MYLVALKCRWICNFYYFEWKYTFNWQTTCF